MPDPARLLSKIPPFPPIVMRVMALLAREDVEIRELTSLIVSDPSFAAQLLRFANSPLFGLRAQIDSVHHALVVLGLKRVQRLTATVATSGYVRRALKYEELRRCWRHTLACAFVTQELARALSTHEDRAYTAGLLHDVGRLGMLVAYPEQYAHMIRNADRNNLCLLDQETELFGMDHCAAGRLLAERWNLPEVFRVVAGRHHDSQEALDNDLLSVVHLACRLSDSLGFHVTAPVEPLRFEVVRNLLPARARSRFPSDEDVLRASIEEKIRAHDGENPGQMPPRVRRAEEQEEAEPPAEPEDRCGRPSACGGVTGRPSAEAGPRAERSSGSCFRRDVATAMILGGALSAAAILLMLLAQRSGAGW